MPRTATVSIRITHETKAALEKTAREDGITLGEYIERVLVQHMSDSSDMYPQVPAYLDPEICPE